MINARYSTIRAERIVLAAILRSGPCVMDGTHLVVPEDFGQPLHRMLYDVAAKHRARACVANIFRVADEMEAALPDGDVRGYVLRLWQEQCSAVGLLAAVGRIKDAAHGRRPILLPRDLVQPVMPVRYPSVAM